MIYNNIHTARILVLASCHLCAAHIAFRISAGSLAHTGPLKGVSLIGHAHWWNATLLQRWAEHAFAECAFSMLVFYLFLFIYVCENKKLTIRCWTGLYPWLCPCRCRCRCFLLLFLRLFASRRRSLLGFSSAPKTPYLPDSLPPHLPPHLSTVAPSLGSRPGPAPKSARRLLCEFFFFFFCCTNQQSGFYRRGSWPQEEKIIQENIVLKFPIQE